MELHQVRRRPKDQSSDEDEELLFDIDPTPFESAAIVQSNPLTAKASTIKHEPEVPDHIMVQNPTEEEMKFWAAIMDLDTYNGDSSVASSAVSEASSAVSSAAAESIEESNHSSPKLMDLPPLGDPMGGSAPISVTGDVSTKKQSRNVGTASLGLMGLMERNKTEMHEDGDDNEQKEYWVPPHKLIGHGERSRGNSRYSVRSRKGTQVLEDDEGYVEALGCDAPVKKTKSKLPSPTPETNTAVEMGMWALLKQRKIEQKFNDIADSESASAERNEKEEDNVDWIE